MKIKLLTSICIVSLLSTFFLEKLYAQQALEVSTSERFIAYSLYNFSKLIDWPNSATASTFKIAVVGDKRVYVELISLSQNRKVGNATYNIVFYKDISEIIGYHQMIYLSNLQSGRIGELKEQIKNGGVLLVTERKGMTNQGSTISFLTKEDGTMGFEIARQNALKNQLVIKSQLERMAVSVI